MDKLLIINVNIIDGTGSEPFTGDVLVVDGRIAAMGSIGAVDGCETIDADGRCLTPGFIDIHRHADLQAFSPAFGAAELSQGITTCISGNCGMSAAPCPTGREDNLYQYLEPCLGKPPMQIGFPTFSEYAQRLSTSSLPLNVGAFVGSGTVRIAVKGFDPTPMTKAEMDSAKGFIAEAMQAGAMGLSMGLMYAPECNYSTDELVALARVAGRQGGLLAVHMRGEGGSLCASVEEVIAIANRAEIPLNISHFKAAGRSNWGGMLHRAIGLIESARARGQDVTCDVYPYAAGSTMLLTVLPPSFLAGGVEAALAALARKETHDRLRAELSKPGCGWDNLVLDLGWGNVVVSSTSRPENRRFIGRCISEIASAEGVDEVDIVCGLLVSEDGKVGMVLHSMSPGDVEQVLRLPYSSIISDSLYPPAGNPHPRLYGAFPRVIREYVREKGILTLPEAIQKMTSLPASRVGLRDRGLIKQGYIADILLFHPKEVLDTATYADPVQLALGMNDVFVGGNAAIRNGKIQEQKYGTFIERQAGK